MHKRYLEECKRIMKVNCYHLKLDRFTGLIVIMTQLSKSALDRWRSNLFHNKLQPFQQKTTKQLNQREYELSEERIPHIGLVTAFKIHPCGKKLSFTMKRI